MCWGEKDDRRGAIEISPASENRPIGGVRPEGIREGRCGDPGWMKFLDRCDMMFQKGVIKLPMSHLFFVLGRTP
jgi:hypothetical protein